MEATPKELVPDGIPLSELKSADADALLARCGGAVLMLSLGGMVPPRLLERTRTQQEIPDVTGESVLYIVPIRKRDGGNGPILVGRASTNDVVINDVTLSKLHAFIRESSEGFVIEDGGSKNGTYVEHAEVAKRGEGPATPIRSSATVRFGTVSALFLVQKDLRKVLFDSRG